MSTPPQLITLYHNPACSKSREAHRLLTENLGPENFRVVEYLNQPLPKPLLATLATKLPEGVRSMVRPKDAEAVGIDHGSCSDDELLSALADHPQILQRPIAEAAVTAVIGRPPEQVLDLLSP